MRRIIRIFKIAYFKIKYKGSLEICWGVLFRKNFKLNINGGRVFIGKGVFFNNNCSINSQESIIIGDNTILGENVGIYDHNHRYKDRNKLIKEQGCSTEAIKIGSNCWIGTNVVILKGVCIGDNVIVGANSLIYKSIPSNSIVKSNNNITIERY